MTSDPSRHEAAFFRAAAVPAGIATVVVAVVAGLTEGAGAAWGSVLGGILVIAFFGADHAISARGRHRTPAAVTGLVMGGYVVKLALLATVLAVFRDSTWFSATALAVAVVIVTVVWIAAHVRAFARRRMLYVETGASDVA